MAGTKNAAVFDALEMALDTLTRLDHADPANTPASYRELEAHVVKLARILLDIDCTAEARRLLETCVQTLPDCVEALLALGEIELDEAFFERALGYLERARANGAATPEFYKLLAAVYERTQRYDEADAAWRTGYPAGTLVREYEEERPDLPRLLALATPLVGNLRFRNFVSPEDFNITRMFAESYTAQTVLPEFDLVFNGLGDPDVTPRGLRKAKELLARVGKPFVNHPDAVLPTNRFDTAARLATLRDVVVPRVVYVTQAELAGPDPAAVLRRHGFTPPLLVRLPGYHSGQKFEKITAAEDLASVAADFPGDAVMLISYLDTADREGLHRKYRVMFIGGELYPLHLAASPHWKVHYYTSEMEHRAELRAEEARFLRAMPAVLGAKAMRALHNICELLALDYGGIDFALDASGNIVVYEANAGMLIELPDAEPKWDYRRPAIERALAAARAMVRKKAGLAVDVDLGLGEFRK